MSATRIGGQFAPLSMTLDWKIYRELYRQSDDPLWGMFPHPPIGQIAATLGVSKVTVWRRLGAMQKSGFLSGFDVMPNPTLLGVGLAAYRVNVPDRRARVRLLDELESVDGVMSAQLDFGRSAVLVAVADLPAAQSRRERLIQRIDGVEGLIRTGACWVPPCPSSIPADSWRFIWELRQHPTHTIEELAAALGISRKTASRRYSTLRAERAMLSQYLEDFTKYPGAVVGTILTLDAGTDPRTILPAARRLYPDALEPPSILLPPGKPRDRPGFLREVSSPASAEHEIAALLAIPGVATVESWLPGVSRAYRSWVDARMFEMMARMGVAPGPSVRDGSSAPAERAPKRR